jgi:hypothetical protein
MSKRNSDPPIETDIQDGENMMAKDDDRGLSGSELQQSQSGGGSGEFGGNRNQTQPGRPMGGGPTDSDNSSAGGSSGTGGYGNSQNVANHQGQQPGGPSSLAGGDLANSGRKATGQSRGEKFDEAQGGGRGPESVSTDAPTDELGQDQQDHQDRGQSSVEFEDEQS